CVLFSTGVVNEVPVATRAPPDGASYHLIIAPAFAEAFSTAVPPTQTVWPVAPVILKFCRHWVLKIAGKGVHQLESVVLHLALTQTKYVVSGVRPESGAESVPAGTVTELEAVSTVVWSGGILFVVKYISKPSPAGIIPEGIHSTCADWCVTIEILTEEGAIHVGGVQM